MSKMLDFSVNLLTNYAYGKMTNEYGYDRDDAKYILGQATRVANKAMGKKSTRNIRAVVRHVERRVERRVDRQVIR